MPEPIQVNEGCGMTPEVAVDEITRIIIEAYPQHFNAAESQALADRVRSHIEDIQLECKQEKIEQEYDPYSPENTKADPDPVQVMDDAPPTPDNQCDKCCGAGKITDIYGEAKDCSACRGRGFNLL